MKSMLRLAALRLCCTFVAAVSAQDNVTQWCDPGQADNCTDERYIVEFTAPVSDTSVWSTTPSPGAHRWTSSRSSTP